MTAPGSDFDIHSIHFLSNPSLAGLTDGFHDMGVILGTDAESGTRAMLLVDHEYAVTALAGLHSLEGHVSLSALAVRWIRAGWPEDWGPDLDPSWVPVYPREVGA